MAKANVVKKEESQLPALSLDLMEGDAHSGLENISQDDLATPRLKVLMQLSPELEDLEGAKAGMIFSADPADPHPPWSRRRPPARPGWPWAALPRAGPFPGPQCEATAGRPAKATARFLC